jgi:hypothetical protein
MLYNTTRTGRNQKGQGSNFPLKDWLIEIVLFQFGIKCPAADAKYLDGL